MIIEKIILKNFLCFKNETIEFGPRANIILGRNRTGKSKIFDAFNWVLFDRIWITNEREWRKTKKCACEILNNEAFHNSKDGEVLDVSVSLHFTSKNVKYVLDKEMEIYNNKEKRMYDGDAKEFLKKTENSETVNVDSQSIKNEINKVINKDISNYILFQGEAVNDLVSIGKNFYSRVNG